MCLECTQVLQCRHAGCLERFRLHKIVADKSQLRLALPAVTLEVVKQDHGRWCRRSQGCRLGSLQHCWRRACRICEMPCSGSRSSHTSPTFQQTRVAKRGCHYDNHLCSCALNQDCLHAQIACASAGCSSHQHVYAPGNPRRTRSKGGCDEIR